MKYKLRLTVTPETIEGETRYLVQDHLGERWGFHGSNGYHYSMGDNYITGTKEHADYWRKWTSATPEEAIAEHGPALDKYTILSPDTRLVKIAVEFLAESQRDNWPFYAFADEFPLFNTKPQAGEYFAFTTIDDVQELFLYSDIKHISFKEF